MPASMNPDVYLLYEYSAKTSFTVRMKFILDEPIDGALLKEAAQEPIARDTGSKSCVGLSRMIKFMRDPTTREKYYYEIELPAGEFMTYAKSIGGSPNTVMSALMIKAIARYYDEVEEDHISMCIADDYHKDVGVPDSYRDLVRFIHVMYDWSAKDASVKSLSMTARDAIKTQALPELSYERVRAIEKIRQGIDAQPDLESKKGYATENSLYRKDYLDTGTLSYVGQVDYGQMSEHIKGIYTITDGDMMIELNALPDTFYLSLEMVDDDPELTEVFCDVLREEGLSFTISACKKRSLPTIQLPEA